MEKYPYWKSLGLGIIEEPYGSTEARISRFPLPPPPHTFMV